MAYWIEQFILTAVSYGFIMFVWPQVVFYRHLKNRSRTYRFGFCSLGMVIFINTLVLGLGLVHLLSSELIFLFMFGVFLIQLFRNFGDRGESFKYVRRLIEGTIGRKSFILLCLSKLRNQIKKIGTFVKNEFETSRFSYILLLVIVAYGMVYLNYGAFQVQSFGFGDQYVHLQWISGLVENKIFYDGIYPEAMHCIIYVQHAMFGVSLYSLVLFAGGIHIATLMISIYLFVKEITKSRFMPHVVLLIFLTLDSQVVDEIFGMSRLQWTLPQEYALFAEFLCAAYLLRFLKYGGFKTKRNEKKSRLYWNEDLFLFMLSIAASIAIHFYVTIMAVFICIPVALFYATKVFRPRYFFPLLASVILGFVIAVAPMGTALAAGYPLQGSLTWAMNIIKGSGTKEGRTVKQEVVTVPEANTDSTAAANNNAFEESENTDNSASTSGVPVNTGTTSQQKNSLTAKLQKLWQRFVIEGLYQSGFATLYLGFRARFLWLSMALIMTGLFVINIVIRVAGVIKKDNRFRNWSDCWNGYCSVVAAAYLVMFIYAAPLIGLPEIVAGSRLCSTERVLLITSLVTVADICICMMKGIVNRLQWKVSPAVISVSIVGLMISIVSAEAVTGTYHGYLYYELTRYPSVVNLTNRIVNTIEKDHFTIVSTTDELYQIYGKGYHEELLTFDLNISMQGNYSIPTEYVFLYVEKKPIKYAQSYYFEGPAWIALQKYPVAYEHSTIEHGEISAEKAQADLIFSTGNSKAASALDSREILESKAYHWIEDFQKVYPNDGQIIYEDEDFLCFAIKQSMNSLNRLGLEVKRNY